MPTLERRYALAVVLLCWIPSVSSQARRPDIVDPTVCVVRVNIPVDSALTRASRLLLAVGYELDGAVDPYAIETRPRYVRGAGMMTVEVRVEPIDSGALVRFSGEVRRMRRILVVSATSPSETIVADGRSAHQRAAWGFLSDYAHTMRFGEPRLVDRLRSGCESAGGTRAVRDPA